LVVGNKPSNSQLALAVYNLAGYGLGTIFPPEASVMALELVDPAVQAEFIAAIGDESKLTSLLADDAKAEALGPVLTILLPIIARIVLDRLKKRFPLTN
jgi:hypothetical protein